METTTLAGSTKGHQDGQGAAAQFNRPVGVVAHPDGGAFVSENEGHVIRTVTAGGVVATFVGSGTKGYQDGQGTTAQFNNPGQLARDKYGNLYVADRDNHLIRKVTPGGLVSTSAGTGAAGKKDGHCSEATFNNPTGVAVSPTTGNIIIADSGNDRIRVIILPENYVFTLAGSTRGFADGVGAAAKFNWPYHVVCGIAGDVHVADSLNHRIRKITVADRAVATLAGDGTSGHRDGAGAQARFSHPCGVAMDGGGNVLVTERRGHRVRMVTPAGATSTLAGDGTQGDADGQGAAARFDRPQGVTVNDAGNLLVCDSDNHGVRQVAAGLAPPASLCLADVASWGQLEALADDLGSLLGEGEVTYHDVEFRVEGKIIRAHKNILAARLEYFATMFGSGFAEGTGGGATSSSGGNPAPPLPVQDTTPAAFRSLLRFLYTGTAAANGRPPA